MSGGPRSDRFLKGRLLPVLCGCLGSFGPGHVERAHGNLRGLSLPEIKSGHIGDGDRQGLDSKECFQRAQPRAIWAHPCSMTSECACRCNSPYTIAARGADDVRQIPRCDPCIPCGSNRSAVLHKRFAKVTEETSGGVHTENLNSDVLMMKSTQDGK